MVIKRLILIVCVHRVSHVLPLGRGIAILELTQMILLSGISEDVELEV